ncbi:hypothetical protein SARC_12759, partial [Sphaeroforma arctica JP610]
DSLREANKIIKQILRVKDADFFPLVLAGNKCDLEDDRQITFDEGKKAAEDLGNIPFIETSAKLGVNVDQAFYELVRLIRKQNKPKEEPKKGGKPASTKKEKKKKGCVLF